MLEVQSLVLGRVVGLLGNACQPVSDRLLAAQQEQNDVATRLVPIPLLLGQLVAILVCLAHRSHQTLNANEGKQVNTHPSEGSSIDVQAEVYRVEVDDFTRWVAEEVSVALWDGMGTLLGEHRHQLFERSQRLAHHEINLHFVAFD